MFSYCVIISIVSSFLFFKPNIALSENNAKETQEKELATPVVETKDADNKEKDKDTAKPTSSPSSILPADTKKSDEIKPKTDKKDVKSSDTTKETQQDYEIYPITIPKTELPEDVHIIENNLNLSDKNRETGTTQAPDITISVKKGNMKLNLNVDPTYSDLYFDINLKDIGVEEAQFPKELKPKKEELSQDDKEKTAQQERLLNKIDEMMKTLEKSRQAEKELKEQQEKAEQEKEKQKQQDEQQKQQKEQQAKEEVLTQKEKENKTLSHIDKSRKYYYSKKYGLALKEVQESLKYTETATGYALEGTIYLALDDTTSAVSSWKKALTINPNMKEIRDMLEYYQNEE